MNSLRVSVNPSVRWPVYRSLGNKTDDFSMGNASLVLPENSQNCKYREYDKQNSHEFARRLTVYSI